MVIRFKRLRPGAIIPKRGTPESAGLDLSACLEGPLILKAGETALVPTGLAAELPQGTAGMVYARSGLAAKLGIALANGVGVVDSDYRGELAVPLRNHGSDDFILNPGDRIAQLVVTPVLFPNIEEAETLGETLRGGGGFGSTGTAKI